MHMHEICCVNCQFYLLVLVVTSLLSFSFLRFLGRL